MLGVGVSLRHLRGTTAAFSPASLFASGEEGAWYEPSTTTAFLSTTDLTPCDYGDGCGFLLDKSQGAVYADGSFTGLGSELVTNGTFDTDVSGWGTFGIHSPTFTQSSGVAVFSASKSIGTNGARQVLTGLTTGKVYYVECQARVTAGGELATIRWANGDVTSGFTQLGATGSAAFESIGGLFVAQSSTATIAVIAGGLGATVSTYTSEYDNISVRELPGNHATQVTAGARPILARVPEGGRRNLLEKTEQFDDAYWDPINVTVDGSTGYTDPVGGTSADLVTASGNPSNLHRDITLTTASYSLSFYLKYSNSQWVRIGYVNSSTNAAWFDLQNGVKGSVVGAGNSSTIEPIGGGWYRCSLVISSAVATLQQLFVSQSNSDGSTTSTASGSFYIWGAQLETGSTATAYQKVVDEYDITEAGVTSLDYLAFDGVDDFMTAGTNADWKYLHDGTGCEWIIGLTPAAADNTESTEAIFATKDGGGSSIGAQFRFDDRSSISRNNSWVYGVNFDGGSVFTETNNDTISSLTGRYVVRGGHKSSETPQYFLYHNEVLDGSGSYSASPDALNSQYALTIGKNYTSGAEWSGGLFSLIIRDTQMTTAERSNTSAYVAAKSGVTL